MENKTRIESMPKQSNYLQSVDNLVSSMNEDRQNKSARMLDQMGEASQLENDVRFHPSNSQDYKQVHE